MFRNVRLSIQDTPTPAHATHTTHTAYFKTKCQTWFFYKLIFSALHLWCLIKLFEVEIHSTECGSVPPRLLWNLSEGQLGRLLADAECQSNQIVCQTEELGWAFHFKKIADYEANDILLKEWNSFKAGSSFFLEFTPQIIITANSLQSSAWQPNLTLCRSMC